MQFQSMNQGKGNEQDASARIDPPRQPTVFSNNPTKGCRRLRQVVFSWELKPIIPLWQLG
jgi:hypothetical protein